MMPEQVTSIFLKSDRQRPMLPVNAVEAVAGKGFRGDISYGRKSRQVLIVEQEVLEALNLHPGTLRENLTVKHMRLDTMEAGAVLKVGDALLQLSGQCTPCDKMNAIRPGLKDALQGRRGVLANVIRDGIVRVGDTITYLPLQSK